MKGSAKVVLFSVLAVFAVSAALAFAQAAAPAQEQLPLQGFLKDSTGKPVTQDLSITFNLYDVATAGTALFTETQTVSVKKGNWYARLGKTAAFPAAVKFDKEYYVELEIGGNKLAPRILVAPGAFVARKSFAVADGSITAAKLADGAAAGNIELSTTKMDASKGLKDQSITNPKIAKGSVSGDRIAGGALSIYSRYTTSANFIIDPMIKKKGTGYTGGETNVHESAAPTGTYTGIQGDKIADNAIGSAHIANNAVTSVKIADGTVGTADLANGAVTKEKLSGVLPACAFCRKQCGGDYPQLKGAFALYDQVYSAYETGCTEGVSGRNPNYQSDGSLNALVALCCRA